MTQVYSGFDHCNQCWPAVVPGKVFSTPLPGHILICRCEAHYNEWLVEQAPILGGGRTPFEQVPVLRENGFWK